MTDLLGDEHVALYLAARTSVEPGDDGCWLWTNKPDRDGYGVAYFGGRQWRAHRLSYENVVGPIPDGLELDHTCEVRLCVRPSHLEPVTNFENFVRKYLRAGRTREDAEKLATWDIEMIQRDHEAKVTTRAKAKAAVAAGILPGAKVRRGKTRRASEWTVVEVRPGAGASIWLDIESANGYRILVSLDEVTPV